MAPVGALRRLQVALQMPDEAGERVLHEVAEVDAVIALRGRVRRARTPDVDQLVPVDHLELDLDANLAEVLLDELVHRQRRICPEPEAEISAFTTSGFAGP